MTTAIADLKTEKNFIIIPGNGEYRIREDITVSNISDFLRTHLSLL